MNPKNVVKSLASTPSIKTHNWKLWILLIICSLLPLFALLQPGLPKTHDGQDHVARIANFYQSLSEGNVVPRWGGNLNWGYGHPVLMFLYPLPSYGASALHFLGFSFTDSLKVLFGITFVASVLAMYLWVRAQWNMGVALIGALVYGFAPYRFVDLYVRGAIGEHVAFVFIPLVLFGLLQLARSQKNHIQAMCVVIFSAAGLVLSHNAVTIMMIPIYALYWLYLINKEAVRPGYFVIQSIIALSLSTGVSAFFWVPAYFEGKFTLRDIVTAGEYASRFVSFSDFFASNWSYGGTNLLSKSLGWPMWIGIGAVLLAWKKCESKTKILLSLFGIVLATSLFLMTSQSGLVWQKLTILQKFQFPWRFLIVATLAGSVLAGVSLRYLCGNNKIYYAICILFTVFVSIPTWQPASYLVKPDSFYTNVYEGTTDTGESSPIWSVRFMEHPPDKQSGVINGEAIIIEKKRTSTVHEYTISSKGSSRIVENTLYFPGWRVYVDDIQAGLQFQDPSYRGLMTYLLDNGVHNVRVVFENTGIRKISETVSMMSLGVIVLMVVLKKQINRFL